MCPAKACNIFTIWPCTEKNLPTPDKLSPLPFLNDRTAGTAHSLSTLHSPLYAPGTKRPSCINCIIWIQSGPQGADLGSWRTSLDAQENLGSPHPMSTSDGVGVLTTTVF